MDLPTFRRGFELVSAELNKLSNAIRAASITSVINGSFTRTPGGTTIIIGDQVRGGGGGGSTAFCPFKVTDASTSTELKINIAWGVIANRIPTGMFPNDSPQLVMTIESSVFVYAAITFDLDTLNVSGISFVTDAEVKTNTTTTQYWLIATVTVDTTGESPVISKTMNVCQEPYASPCQLATA
jgi:hypothetical protein